MVHKSKCILEALGAYKFKGVIKVYKKKKLEKIFTDNSKTL